MARASASGRPRITGGRLRGRLLPEVVADGVRPTASRVREALFSMVGQDLEGIRVLDACGGTGLLGFEAWSRGAAVVIAEREPTRAEAVRRAAGALGAGVDVRLGDVTRCVAGERFDLVLVDPPYAEPAAPILAALARCGARVWVLEHAAGAAPPEVAGLALERTRAFGAGALSLYVPADRG